MRRHDVDPCANCKPMFRIDYDNGYMCAGITDAPERPCDVIRLCQARDGVMEIQWDFAPDEAVGVASVLTTAVGAWMEERRLRPCATCGECKHEEVRA